MSKHKRVIYLLLPILLILSTLQFAVNVSSYSLDFSTNGWANPTSPMIASGFSDFDSSLYLSSERVRHAGIDLLTDNSSSQPVYAIADGYVYHVEPDTAPEKNESVIFIRHKTNTGLEFTAVYGHTYPTVSDLTSVTKGQILGYTTKYNVYHLHFGINVNSNIETSGTLSTHNGWGMILPSIDPTNLGWRNPISWLGQNSAVSSGSNAPTLNSPSDGVTITAGTSTNFSWSSTGAAQYQILFTNPSGSQTEINTTGQTYTPFTPDSSGTWHWKVISKNSSGVPYDSWSLERSFTVPGTPPTTAPNLISPSDNVTITLNSSTNFTWSSTGAAQYQILFTNPSGSQKEINTTGQTYIPFAPDSSGTWLWKVISKDSSGVEYGSWSSERSFIVPGTPPTVPEAPTGVYSPSKTDITIDLSWNSVTGASGYNIFKDSTQINSSPIMTTTYTVLGLTGNTTYNFAITAVNNDGESLPNVINVTTSSSPTNYQVTLPARTFSYNIWFIPIVNSKYYFTVSNGTSDLWSLYDEQGKYIDDIFYSDSMKPILQAGDKYALVVFGDTYIDTTLNILFSNTVQIVSQPAPLAPTGLSATSLSTSNQLTWKPVSGADGYQIYRATSSTGAFTWIANSSTNRYADTGIPVNTIFYYKVKSYKKIGATTVYSDSSTLVGVVPNPIGVSAVSNSYNSNKISWTGISGADGYQIYRSASSAGVYTWIGNAFTTSYINEGLTTNTTYYYKIKAYKTIGTLSVFSNYSVATFAKPIPAAPQSVVAVSASYNSIKISWAAVSGSDGYQLYRSAIGTGTYTWIANASTNSYINLGLTTGTTYYYKVKAYKMVGGTTVFGNDSKIISAKPIPAVPTGVSASSASATSNKISWTSVSGANGYQVYRSLSATGTYSWIANVWTNSYTNIGLTTGTTYYYKIKAMNSGTSPITYSTYSSTVAATAVAPLGIPTNLSASTPSATSTTLSWTSVSGANGYQVYRSDSATGTYSWIANAWTNSYTNIELTTGTTYYYKIKAMNSGTTPTTYSAYSNYVSCLAGS